MPLLRERLPRVIGDPAAEEVAAIPAPPISLGIPEWTNTITGIEITLLVRHDPSDIAGDILEFCASVARFVFKLNGGGSIKRHGVASGDAGGKYGVAAVTIPRGAFYGDPYLGKSDRATLVLFGEPITAT